MDAHLSVTLKGKKSFHRFGNEWSGPYGFLAKLNTPLKSVLDYAILRQIERGRIRQIFKEVFQTERLVQLASQGTENIALGFEHLFTCFAVYLVASFFGLAILCFEMLKKLSVSKQ